MGGGCTTTAEWPVRPDLPERPEAESLWACPTLAVGVAGVSSASMPHDDADGLLFAPARTVRPGLSPSARRPSGTCSSSSFTSWSRRVSALALSESDLRPRALCDGRLFRRLRRHSSPDVMIDEAGWTRVGPTAAWRRHHVGMTGTLSPASRRVSPTCILPAHSDSVQSSSVCN